MPRNKIDKLIREIVNKDIDTKKEKEFVEALEKIVEEQREKGSER